MRVDVQAEADARQADYYRGVLEGTRSEAAAELAEHVRRLTECMTSGEMASVSVVRRSIRNIENDIRKVDRMLDRLNLRFPGESLRRRA
jgi:hypothetical protein